MKIIPDFIIAGAPKCGTTALWHFLDELPEVCMASIKEPRFFTEVKGDMEKEITGDGPRQSGNFYRGFSWYNKLFEHRKDGQLLGEGTTLYFSNVDASGKIKEHCPDVKLIFMLRNPADRVYSHYWQEYKLGFDLPSFEDMVKNGHDRFSFYMNTSRYKKHLQRYLDSFAKENILIIIQEDFKNDPQREFKRVLEFLGLPDNSMSEINLKKQHNQQVVSKNSGVAKLLTRLQNSTIANLLPHAMRRRFGHLRKWIFSFNSKKLAFEGMNPGTRILLMEQFHDDITFVRDLLQRPNNLWND